MLEAAVILLLLHGVDGREIIVNPLAVVSMHAATGEQNRLLTDKVKCLVNTSDGKRLPVVESCEAVSVMINQK